MSSFRNKQNNYREESHRQSNKYALKQQIIKHNLMLKHFIFVLLLQIFCTSGIIREYA